MLRRIEDITKTLQAIRRRSCTGRDGKLIPHRSQLNNRTSLVFDAREQFRMGVLKAGQFEIELRNRSVLRFYPSREPLKEIDYLTIRFVSRKDA
jgi:hypothetical protein